MRTEPNTPVLVGAAAVDQHVDTPGGGLDDVALMVEAARAAIADSGAGALADQVDWVGATRGLAEPPNPGAVVAAALGATARTTVAAVGVPQQTLFNGAFERILRGEARVAVVCGGEAKRRADVARRAGVELLGPLAVTPADEEIGPEGEIVAPPEIAVRAYTPVVQYAMIENARRAARGWSIDRHLDDIAGLWAGFNAVAGDNPRAAFAAPMSAEEIRTTAPDNRLLAFPYNKWHNSQWSVDQAAAFVICSAEVAEAAGVARDRWVFPHVALESSHSQSLSRRVDLAAWPAMGVLGRTAAERTGTPVGEMDHLELYSCFPVAVRVQQAELGIDPERIPTLTGGMAFAGGPFNNFVYQATVAMVDRLRTEPGTLGAVSVVSGLLTKPGLTVWSTEPPAAPVLVADLAAEAAAAAGEIPLAEAEVASGPGRVATYTVTPDEGGPARITAIVDLADGTRAAIAVDDRDLAVAAMTEDLNGAAVTVDATDFAVD